MGGRPKREQTAEALYRLLTTAVRQMPRDVSLTSLATLGTLERTGPRRITELAVTEGITQPSMTSLITVLERNGLVERRSDPKDGRVSLIALTDEGAAYLRHRRQGGSEAMLRLIDKLSPDEAAALATAVPALKRLREIDDEQRDPNREIPKKPAGTRAPKS